MSERDIDLKDTLQVVWGALPPKRKRQYLLILALMLISSIADVVSLGAVVPFLAVLLSPEKVLEFRAVSLLFNSLGLTDAKDLIPILTFAFCFSATLAGIIRISLLYGNSKLSCLSGADLGIEVYRRTLYQPYKSHLLRNSSDVISGITKVDTAVIVLSQCMTLLSSALTMVLILFSLFLIHAEIAGIAILGLGLSYGIITSLSRARLLKNSKRISDERTKVLKAKQEGLGGIRDILLDGTQDLYCDIYAKADLPLRSAIGNNIFLSGSPRHLMEALGMVLIAALAFYLSKQEGGVASAFPALGALAMGAQRLLPALQQGYGAWATIVGCYQSLIHLVELIQQPLPAYALRGTSIEPMVFNNSITLKNITFNYGSEDIPTLRDISFKIEKGEKVGVVGTTGSGKSTLINIIMGLLTPSDGEIYIDGCKLDSEDAISWQRNIAHVPQSIYLSDSSLEENIAFGVKAEDIDKDLVQRAARQAQISSFIQTLPEGYQTKVGERGVRLSGGQKQRIGVARALYKNANILVLDEATSALDNDTETSLMKSLDEIDNELTVIMIAHRFATIKNCEKVIVLEEGKVASIGSIHDLEKNCSTFQRLSNQERFAH